MDKVETQRQIRISPSFEFMKEVLQANKRICIQLSYIHNEGVWGEVGRGWMDGLMDREEGGGRDLYSPLSVLECVIKM